MWTNLAVLSIQREKEPSLFVPNHCRRCRCAPTLTLSTLSKFTLLLGSHQTLLKGLMSAIIVTKLLQSDETGEK